MSWFTIALIVLLLILAGCVYWAIKKIQSSSKAIRFFIILGMIASPCVGQDVDFTITKDHPIVTPAAEIANLQLFHWLEADQFWRIDENFTMVRMNDTEFIYA